MIPFATNQSYLRSAEFPALPVTKHPVTTKFPDRDEKIQGGKKEKAKRKGNVAHIYCMTVQITAHGKINLPATKMCNPL